MKRTLMSQPTDNAISIEKFTQVSPGKAKKMLWSTTVVTVLIASLSLGLAGCNDDDDNDNILPGANGPVTSETPVVHALGDAANGKTVFRFETFGNELFWTDAVKLQQGIVAAGVTPVQALQLGLSVDIEALDAATVTALQADLLTETKPLLNNPATTLALINANAVIGIVAVDSNNDGTIDVANGDKTGPSCALCHTITDGTVFSLPNGGSIGKRLDGRAVHNLNFGALAAAALNSRALYPMLQLKLAANGGKTLGRAPLESAIDGNSTEVQVDAYLSNPAFYPVGMFDDTVDGNGDPMHNSPLFRTDLAAPWGTEGSIARLDNFSNLVYTVLFDPTTLTTPNGRAFLRKLGGTAAGTEIADTYVNILAATDVTGYPFVQADAIAPPQLGSEDAPLGLRVNNQKLLDMNAYLNSLPAPAGAGVTVTNAVSRARGRQLFRENCTSCHNVDQGKPVPAFVVGMKSIFPGDNPVTLLPTRDAPLNAILNTVANIFDDKMAVVNASIRGDKRGTAMPLLLDLERKPNFLHDNSVPTLDALLNPTSPGRTPDAPHPFFIADASKRDDVVAFLKSLDTSSNNEL